jgi:Domain of unknown function (DUF2017)
VVFRRRRAPVLSRRRDGRWQLNLEPDERRLLASLAEQLRDLLDDEPDDPSLERLRPPAYPDDPEAEAGYRLLAGEELRESRHAALAVLASTGELEVIDDDQATAWMQAINALRLVVGTRLDVSEDDEGPTSLADPDAPMWALYGYLTQLLGRTIEALQG